MTAPPRACPPESMRPDRQEVVTPAGSGKLLDIEPGMQLECLVGAYNGSWPDDRPRDDCPFGFADLPHPRVRRIVVDERCATTEGNP